MPRRRVLIAAAATILGALVVPGVASASPQATAADLPVASDATNLGGYGLDVQDPLGVFGIDIDVSSKVVWTGKFQAIAGWETANVRQGSYLKVTRNAPIQTGQLKVTWKVDGAVELINKAQFPSFPEITTSATAVCTPLTFGDDAYSCTAASDALTVFRTPGIPFSPYAKVVLKARFSITPEGAIVDRRWSVPDYNGTSGTASGLGLGLLGSAETIKVPCSAGVGLPLYYKLSNLSYAPDVVVTQQTYGQVGFTDGLGLIELPAVYEGPLTTAKKTTFPALTLKGSGTGATWNLGDIKPNTTAPLVDEDKVFHGQVGKPITFSVATWSECAIESYEWEFSTGGKSFGKTPSRTFTTPGWHTGQVTVTDETGLKTKKAFTFKVS
ncbi:PKD domain-containing protein [Solirubrobacter phytolaccae]|uniref:PKD domain-containing protein n=1 Tax=Solirubrobacter phytolaccae TaxID=1404360 RepID=A0A9X3NI65_9ACTN|nr:PKD domain-containing protein [Solirubrobacter phytolaccae]MDA0185355.1 PKD domain-containing protein [Solirubrobacter phytolaccae]